MTYNQIQCYHTINRVDDGKVNDLVASMLENGWVGAPILIYGESLLTGSHRMAALKEISRRVNDWEIDSAEVLTQEIAEDVTDLVNEALGREEVDEFDYDNLGWMLEGTWVEEYKDEIAEW